MSLLKFLRRHSPLHWKDCQSFTLKGLWGRNGSNRSPLIGLIALGIGRLWSPILRLSYRTLPKVISRATLPNLRQFHVLILDITRRGGQKGNQWTRGCHSSRESTQGKLKQQTGSIDMKKGWGLFSKSWIVSHLSWVWWLEHSMRAQRMFTSWWTSSLNPVSAPKVWGREEKVQDRN